MIRGIPFLAVLLLLFGASEGGSFGVVREAPLSLISSRGGSTDAPPPKKPRKKKKRVKSEEEALEEEKKVIREAMRETDAETALGDAIR